MVIVTSGEVVTMRSASGPAARDNSTSSRPNPSCVDIRSPAGSGSVAGTGTRAGRCRRDGGRGEWHRAQEAFEIRRRHVETGEAIPFGAGHDAVLGAEPFHLLLGHQAGVVVLVAGNRQPIALDGVGDDAGRPVVGKAMEGVEHGRQVVTGEVGHQPRQRSVVTLGEERLDAGDACRDRAPAARATPHRP